jgi:transposase
MHAKTSTKLPENIEACHALITAQAETIQQLSARMDYLVRRLFGTRSERVDPTQLALFDAPAQEAPPEIPDEEEALSPAPKRKGHGRQRLPKDLPRKRVEHDVTPEEKVCPECHREKARIGEDTSEQLDYTPASLHVIEHVCPKYACKHCQEYVVQGRKPPQPIEKGLAGPGLLAHVITSKYCDHLPLNRQEAILARHGVELSRKTLSGWMLQCAHVLEPVVAAMKEALLQSHVLHTDDTPVQVQVKGKKRKTHRSFLWVYAGDIAHPYTVYDFTWTRNREGPEAFLRYSKEDECYRGYLQADAYPGYNRLYATRPILEVGCWAHARRKFYDARVSAPASAHEALRRIKEIYKIEAQAKDDGDDAHALKTRRQCHVKPLLEDFHDWLQARYAESLPKSPFGQACAYSLRLWTALTRYLNDGRLAIDNNAAERAIRPLTIGRKNWLFAGSKRGGAAAATLYSLIQSAKRHQLDPYAYLRDLLTRIPTHPNRQIHQLLPDHWKALAQESH